MAVKRKKTYYAWSNTTGVAGGGPRGPWPPLEKLVILAGQKWDLGRTEMRAWQDRNGSLAGQKWELGRTEMRAWQKIICKTPHFPRFSVIFVCFLPLLVGFYHIFQFFFNFWLFCSHSPAMFAYWQNSLAEKLSMAEQNRRTWPPLTGKNFGRKGLNFGRTEWLAPLWKWPSYAYVPLPTKAISIYQLTGKKKLNTWILEYLY